MKRVTANLTNEEAAFLDSVCSSHGCSKSAVLKASLRNLGSTSTAKQSSLALELPMELQLRALVRASLNEVRKELSTRKTVESLGKVAVQEYELVLKEKGFY